METRRIITTDVNGRSFHMLEIPAEQFAALAAGEPAAPPPTRKPSPATPRPARRRPMSRAEIDLTLYRINESSKAVRAYVDEQAAARTAPRAFSRSEEQAACDVFPWLHEEQG